MQEATPHPSTQAAYQAPLIRPFEPGRDFGRELVLTDPGIGPVEGGWRGVLTGDGQTRAVNLVRPD